MSELVKHQPVLTTSVAKRRSTCRSCEGYIEKGEHRVQIAYPSKIIEFHERTGSVSFFMHPFCFLSRPVDYVKTGPNAWREWRTCNKPNYYRISNEDRVEIEQLV